jgi:hypothetical protein
MTDRLNMRPPTGRPVSSMTTAEGTRNSPAMTVAVVVTLTIWLGLVFVLGAVGVFYTPTATLPLPLLLGFAVPVLLFLALYGAVAGFRDYVLAADLRLTTGVQAWRFAGFAFVALTVYRVLPGLFAWPAGLGDMAIGITAPWVVLALIRQPAFAVSRRFAVWNLLGLLDLAVALGTGALSSSAALGTGGAITTGPMAQLPLVLIPCYFVPIFVVLHLTSLFQARRLRSVYSEGMERNSL